MRRVLVDYARARDCAKREGAAHRTTLNDALILSSEPDPVVIRLHEALEHLAEFDTRKARVVEMRDDGWKLQIVKRRQRAFKITGLTWIVERSFAWLGRNRRFSKDYEYAVQTSETMIDIASIRIMLNRLAPA